MLRQVCAVWALLHFSLGQSLVTVVEWNDEVKFLSVGHNHVVHTVTVEVNRDFYSYFFPPELVFATHSFDEVRGMTTNTRGDVFVVNGNETGYFLFRSPYDDVNFEVIFEEPVDLTGTSVFHDGRNNSFVALQSGVWVYRSGGDSALIRDLLPEMTHFAYDTSGNVFVAFERGNLSVLTPAEIGDVNPAARLINGVPRVSGLAVDGSDAVYCATEHGLRRVTALEQVTTFVPDRNFTLVAAYGDLVYALTVDGGGYQISGNKDHQLSFGVVMTSPFERILMTATKHVFVTTADSVVYRTVDPGGTVFESFRDVPNGGRFYELLSDTPLRALLLAEDLFVLSTAQYAAHRVRGLPVGPKKMASGPDGVYIGAYEGLYRYSDDP